MTAKSIAASVAIIALAFAAYPASAQDKPPIVQRAEKCLAAHVDEVVAVERDLQLATQFLATYACPIEVEGVARYERNQLYLKLFTSMFDSIPSTPPAPGQQRGMSLKIEGRIDLETGDIVIPPAKPGDPPNPLAAMLPQMSSSMAQVVPDAVPSSLKKLAGDLVLAALHRQGSRAR